MDGALLSHIQGQLVDHGEQGLPRARTPMCRWCVRRPDWHLRGLQRTGMQSTQRFVGDTQEGNLNIQMIPIYYYIYCLTWLLSTAGVVVIGIGLAAGDACFGIVFRRCVSGEQMCTPSICMIFPACPVLMMVLSYT